MENFAACVCAGNCRAAGHEGYVLCICSADDVKTHSGDWFSQTVEVCAYSMAIDIKYING